MNDPQNDLPPVDIPSAADQSVAPPQVVTKLSKVSPAGGFNQISTAATLLEIEEKGMRAKLQVAYFAMFERLEDDLKREREINTKLTSELDSFRTLYFQEQSRSSVLQERLDGQQQKKILQNVTISFGGIFAGLGVKLCVDEKLAAGSVFFLVGAVLLFAGWLGAWKKKDVK